MYLISIDKIIFLYFFHFTDEEEDDEEVYKMAGVMAQCGGLECMLNRLSGIKDFKQGRHLLTVRRSFFYFQSFKVSPSQYFLNGYNTIHFWLISWLFSQLMVWYIKHLKKCESQFPLNTWYISSCLTEQCKCLNNSDLFLNPHLRTPKFKKKLSFFKT